MKHLPLIALCCVSLCSCGKRLVDSNVQSLSATTPQIMVHYMPWYSSKPVSGEWGWHWTMNHFDPDTIADDGRREIASHYYPLIGPYDSNDPRALECHVLLMKFAGIDGAIIDWYGIKDHRDYAAIHRNTNHLIAYIKKAGLSFAICYEDQTIKHLVNDGILRESQALSHGQEVLRWMQDHWFVADEYAKIAGRPLLLVFGPQYFKGAAWKELFSGLSQPPYFYTLNTLQEGADGVFGWPPVHGGRVVSPAAWRAYLSQLYEKDGVGTAFPKFHDIYEEAGVRESYGYLDDQEGAVFGETLARAEENASLIQIVTWNDYGEGTIIEPTIEFGYRYLEAIQNYRKKQAGKTFPYSPEDLRLPIALYQLRQQAAADGRAATHLDSAAAFLFASENEAARKILLHKQ
ncbi:MAG: hypothetical protein F4Z57_10455 [Gemmatimonadetes bacterium]|nr:hypothetical protein [Gemmatimonadota bacterium]MYI61146.1 hypothetical protein [Gemmatimonadota bacterium]